MADTSPHSTEKDLNACDCGHAVWWHNDTRGCGYNGFDPRHKCPCSLLAHEAVNAVVTREKAQAWEEGYVAGHAFGYEYAQDIYDGPLEDLTPKPNPYAQDTPPAEETR